MTQHDPNTVEQVRKALIFSRHTHNPDARDQFHADAIAALSALPPCEVSVADAARVFRTEVNRAFIYVREARPAHLESMSIKVEEILEIAIKNFDCALTQEQQR